MAKTHYQWYLLGKLRTAELYDGTSEWGTVLSGRDLLETLRP